MTRLALFDVPVVNAQDAIGQRAGLGPVLLLRRDEDDFGPLGSLRNRLNDVSFAPIEARALSFAGFGAALLDVSL